MIATERALLTLLGLSDPHGRIENFPKTQALDYSELVAGDFERALDELIRSGQVRELPRIGRSRRFHVRDLGQRALGQRYIAQRRDRVLEIEAQRAQLEPGRATLTGPALPVPQVVRALAIAPSDRGPRWQITVIVPGFGTIHRCTYIGGPSPFIMPPSARVGGEWKKDIEWTSTFARVLREAVERFLATQGAESSSRASAESVNRA